MRSTTTATTATALRAMRRLTRPSRAGGSSGCVGNLSARSRRRRRSSSFSLLILFTSDHRPQLRQSTGEKRANRPRTTSQELGDAAFGQVLVETQHDCRSLPPVDSLQRRPAFLTLCGVGGCHLVL